jgi:putative ATP-binding cassette transporter
LIAEISLMDSGEQQEEEYEADNTNVEIVMKDVEYSYSNDSGESFTVGPINCSFRSNEITFITGGNGSGKSTLAKLISGLYIPEKGKLH